MKRYIKSSYDEPDINYFVKIIRDFFNEEDPYLIAMDLNDGASDFVVSQLHLMGVYMEDQMYNEQIIFHDEYNDNEIATASCPIESEDIIIKLTDYGKEFFNTTKSLYEV